MRKPTIVAIQKNMYRKENKTSNYLVCGYCITIAETTRLDEAIEVMEANYGKVSELRIHEYKSGSTWYF